MVSKIPEVIDDDRKKTRCKPIDEGSEHTTYAFRSFMPDLFDHSFAAPDSIMSRSRSGSARVGKRVFPQNFFDRTRNHGRGSRKFVKRLIKFVERMMDAKTSWMENGSSAQLTAGHAFDQNSSQLDEHMMAGDVVENQVQNVAEQNKTVEYLSAFQRINHAIISGENINYVLDLIIRELMGVLRLDGAAFLIYDEDRSNFWLTNYQGFSSFPSKGYRARCDFVLRGSDQNGQFPFVIEDLSSPGISEVWFQTLIDEGCIFYAGIPLRWQGKFIGVIEGYRTSSYQVNPEWLQLYQLIANQAIVPISNDILAQKIDESHVDLLIAYDSTLKGWVSALELRDYDTKGHSERVVELTVRLATEMGVPERKAIDIRRGALLHDIGKLGIPDTILKKAGSLSEEEWVVMKAHPTMAYEWLSEISFLKSATNIPYCHHENWDGSGYPRGLKGEEIPLEARIFAVIDVFDALMSDRPYRKAWDRDRVVDYIIDESGKKFDPQVVKSFVEMLGDICREDPNWFPARC